MFSVVSGKSFYDQSSQHFLYLLDGKCATTDSRGSELSDNNPFSKEKISVSQNILNVITILITWPPSECYLTNDFLMNVCLCVFDSKKGLIVVLQ